MIKELCAIKIEGEVYTFYLNESISYTTGNTNYYISCETPENAFGYPDIVLLDKNAWEVIDGKRVYNPRSYTLHRHLPNWKLKKIQDKMIKLDNQYC